MRSKKVTGIVLKRMDFGEADRLLTVFSFESGKIRALAKGSRKPLSKMAGHIEPCSMTHFQLTEGRNFYVVTGAEMQYPYGDIRQELTKTSLAYYLLEMVDALTVEEEAHPRAFNLLSDGLVLIESLPEEHDNALIATAFAVKLLTELGYLPELSACVQCHNQLTPESNAFSASMGGLLCAECQRLDYGAIPLSATAIKALRLFIDQPLTVVQRLNLDTSVLRELELVTTSSLQQHSDRDLRSASFVREMLAS